MPIQLSLQTDDAGFARHLERDIPMLSRGQLPLCRSHTTARPWWPLITVERPDRISWKQWGMVPMYATRQALPLENGAVHGSLSSELFGDPAFALTPAARQRCLIPITSYFARENGILSCPQGEDLDLHEIRHWQEDVFCVGGLYDGETFAVLTHPVGRSLLERLSGLKTKPVIIPAAYAGDWLKQALSAEDVLRFCDAVDEMELVVRKVVA